jgi:hypothetical protein
MDRDVDYNRRRILGGRIASRDERVRQKACLGVQQWCICLRAVAAGAMGQGRKARFEDGCPFRSLIKARERARESTVLHCS